MAEKVNTPAERPEDTAGMGLDIGPLIQMKMSHLYPGSLYHLFKFILFFFLKYRDPIR